MVVIGRRAKRGRFEFWDTFNRIRSVMVYMKNRTSLPFENIDTRCKVLRGGQASCLTFSYLYQWFITCSNYHDFYRSSHQGKEAALPIKPATISATSRAFFIDEELEKGGAVQDRIISFAADANSPFLSVLRIHDESSGDPPLPPSFYSIFSDKVSHWRIQNRFWPSALR